MRHALLVVSAVVIGACREDPSGVPDAAAIDAAGGDAGGGPSTVRVATFNVRFFFDATCDTGMCGAGSFERTLSDTEIGRRAAEIAGAIRAMDADIVCLEEIETMGNVDRIQAVLGAEYPGRVFGEIFEAGSLDVAVLSRFAVIDARGHRDDEVLRRPDGSTTRFSRELLEVHLDAGGGRRVVAVAAHYKSKNDDDPGRRLAEAQTTARILGEIAARTPGGLVVLGGDLNDVPGSPPLSALDAAGHERVADVPAGDTGTYWFEGTPVWIDHVYRAAGSSGAYVAGSVRIVRDGRGLAGSDHAAIHADFTL